MERDDEGDDSVSNYNGVEANVANVLLSGSVKYRRSLHLMEGRKEGRGGCAMRFLIFAAANKEYGA